MVGKAYEVNGGKVVEIDLTVDTIEEVELTVVVVVGTTISVALVVLSKAEEVRAYSTVIFRLS